FCRKTSTGSHSRRSRRRPDWRCLLESPPKPDLTWPSGVKLMPHRHPEDRIYTVMSGVFYIGLGDRFDGDKVKAYPPGSVIVLPGNTWHFNWAKAGEYVTQSKVFPIAARSNTAVMPHSFYDGPGLLAAIHATAALGSTDAMIEWRRFDLEAQLYGGVLAPQRGRIPVPQGPGLGIDPDPGVIRAYMRV